MQIVRACLPYLWGTVEGLVQSVLSPHIKQDLAVHGLILQLGVHLLTGTAVP